MARERTLVGTDPSSLHWSSIWGGLFVSIGVFVLLNLLGMAIGLAVLDPMQASSLRSVGVGAGIWAGIVQILALLAGGFVTTRFADTYDRFRGALHGVVLWGFATVLSMILGVAFLSSALSAGANVLQAGARAAPGVVEGAGNALGLDAQALVGPVNEQLRQQGKPELTADELQNAMQAAAQSSIRTGRLDRQTVAQALAQHTRLSREDADQVAGQIEAQVRGAGQNVAQAAEDVSDTASGGFWAMFFSTLLGLLAAVVGALLGMLHRDRRERREVRAAVVTPTEPTPIAPPREVYP